MIETPSKGIDPGLPLNEAAAYWWAVLHDDKCSQAQYRQFAQWVSHSPDRVDAYLRIVASMRALTSGELIWPDTKVEELLAEVHAKKNVSRHPRISSAEVSSRQHKWMTRGLIGVAAILLLSVGITIVKPWTESFQTDVGEQLTVQLDDGTVMALNTASRVSVRFYSEARHVELEEGEALFNVAPDANRPFHVETGIADIQAVGTAFNVDRREDHTTVTVVEGHVLVRPLHEPKKGGYLDGGESSGSLGKPVALEESDRLVVNRSGAIARQRLDDVTPITAWTQRRLVFDGRLLAEVASEFNRYNQMQIRIDDASLGQRRVTGSFQADDPRSFLTFVSQITGVSVRTRDGVHIVELDEHSSKGGQTD